MENLYKAIWLEVLFIQDGGKTGCPAGRGRWVRMCKLSGYLHPSV